MPNPFAAVEALVNQRTTTMLANAEADFGGGVVVSGVFDDEFDADFGGMVERTAPVFEAMNSALPSLLHGASVGINGKNYVVGGIQPAKAGITRLILTDT